jgi:hypothetical protein
MPRVLTTNAIITCPHNGLGTTTPASRIWTVDGGFVCAEGDTGTLTCTAPYPCIGYTLRSMGLNASTVVGRRVVLTTDFNLTFTGLPLTMVETHFAVDDSTPVPVPPGQSPPPLDPFLLDLTAPSVQAIPRTFAFNSTTMQPAVLSAAFTLAHPFPMRWLLTLVSEPLATSADISTGLPPGLVVTPAGGSWDASPLTIQLSFTAAYMAGLGIGLTHYYLIGVSQRGLTGYDELVLAVT